MNPAKPKEITKERLTYKEAAEYLGKGVRTIQRWVARGILDVAPVTRSTVFVLRSGIDRMLQERAEAEGIRAADEPRDFGPLRPRFA